MTAVFGMLALVLLTAGSWAWAQETPDPSPEQIDSPTSSEGWGDDGIYEIGVEWINDFPGTQDDRDHWDESCDGLYNKLIKAGWTSRFHWTDWDAWEQDFKLASEGGTEGYYADNVDIAMVCTHGGAATDPVWNQFLSSVYFGSTHDDHDLSPGEAYKAYGDKDLEWLAFDSCSVLSDGGPAPYYNRGYWAATMNGLHLLLGFKNTMYVWAPGDGYKWADYLLGWKPAGWPFYFRPPYRVAQAWFAAVDDVQPDVTCARILAEVPDNYNDYLWGKGYVSPDPVPDGTYWYWDHCSTGGAGLQAAGTAGWQVASTAQAETMPVLRVNAREVNEAYVLDRFVPVFDMPDMLAMEDGYFYLVDTSGGISRTLQVDTASGGFKYQNLSKLWVVPEVNPSLPSVTAAQEEANAFLDNNLDLLPGVQWVDWDSLATVEEIVGVEGINPAAGSQQERVVGSVPMDISVTYGRQPVVATVETPAGPQQVAFPIVGPGARTRVYVGEGGEILGVQGGARDYTEMREQVPVIPAEEAWQRYLLDPSIALPQVPWVADEIRRITERDMLGYYELPHFQGQKDLIPVWIFDASFWSEGNLLAEGVPVQVPAAEAYLPPVVQILSPGDGSGFLAGQVVTLEGVVELYGAEPFSYEWSSSVNGYLGSGEILTAPLTADAKTGQVFSNTIKLLVTDANGQQGSDAVTIIVYSVYLPVLLRNY